MQVFITTVNHKVLSLVARAQKKMLGFHLLPSLAFGQVSSFPGLEVSRGTKVPLPSQSHHRNPEDIHPRTTCLDLLTNLACIRRGTGTTQLIPYLLTPRHACPFKSSLCQRFYLVSPNSSCPGQVHIVLECGLWKHSHSLSFLSILFERQTGINAGDRPSTHSQHTSISHQVTPSQVSVTGRTRLTTAMSLELHLGLQ